MSKFFESEIIRNELKEINQLQQDVYGSMLSFVDMEREDQIEHIEKLSILLDKQRVMYTRLSLSDDPDAKVMKKQIEESAVMMGLPKNANMNQVFKDMTKMVSIMKDQLDKDSLS